MISKDLSKKVLTVSPPYKNPKGGIGSVVNSYMNLFDGFNGVETTSYTGGKIKKTTVFFGALLKYLYYLSFKNIKIVHIHSACYNSFKRKSIFLKIAKRFNKKIILHIHGAEFKVFADANKEFVKKIFEKADTVIALSKRWKDYFEKDLNASNVEIIDNIVDNPIVVSGFEKKDSKLNLLFLGILSERKGILDLLKAINDKKDYFQDKIHLNFGGNGDFGPVKKYINENGLGEMVTYHGWVSGDKKIQLLNEADIYILPSYNEGLPISILEAMSYGMPIISTPVGGIPEIVDEKNGVLITPGNTEELSEAIKRFVDNPEIIKEMGNNSKHKVEPHFPHNVENKLISLYSLFIKGKKP